MIRVEHLSKTYGDVTVLADVNAEIAKGEVISIIGPSGTGKSTFLRCLNLLERPSGGRIEVDGQDILAPGANVPLLRQRMGMVFQSFNLFPHLTVLENLTIGPVRLRGTSRPAAEAAGQELLKMVGLAEKANTFPGQLSGGQKQRVCIARALAAEPDLIICDEPTSALDPLVAEEVLKLLRGLQEDLGLAYMFITHDLGTVRRIAHRTAVMLKGEIIAQGPTAQIFSPPFHPYTEKLISSVPEMDTTWLDHMLKDRPAA
jgi:polar amino acid transport system ATP-binding protein